MNTAIYLRVSTSEQSNDSQELNVREFARRAEYKNLVVYQDKISGKTTSRPELDRLIKDSRHGRVDRILCYKLDRLGRSAHHLSGLLIEFKTLKIPVHFTSQGLSTEESNPVTPVLIGLLGLIAEMERTTIVERVKAGIAARKAKGLPLGRKPTADKIKQQCKDLRTQGLSIREIAEQTKLSIGTVHKACK